MVTVPELTAVARPELFTVATAVLLEVQVAMLVTPMPRVPSANVADAVNWTCDPEVVVWVPGLTARLCMWTVATVKVELLEITEPDFAEMVVEDSLVPDGRLEAAVAIPVLAMVATLALDEFHVTCVVTSPVELLPKVPCAVNAAVPLVRT